LINYLHTKHMLLMFDNFEHIIAAAPIVSSLLESCPQIKALVTSRTLLRLRSEQELPVPMLDLPQHPHQHTADELAKYPAIELFVQRAQNVKPDFKLMANNAETIAEICLRLDGLPLAIELAAARIKILTPQQLLERLQHRFEILRGGTRDLPERQRTLHSTIEWSYNLLDENSKRLFRRMAVFVGGFTLEAAEDVCNATADLAQDILDLMEVMIQNSLLITTDVDGDRRFSLLGIMRDYAFEQLTKSGEVTATQWHHAQYYLALAEKADPQFNSQTRPQWLQRLYLERYNIRAAITWSQTYPDLEIEARFTGALAWFWYFSGNLNEARTNAEHALKRFTQPERTIIRAKVLYACG
ncbi:MAG TPA: hypothetical protein VFK30_11055, partial [Anaerolineae bacterium]|nr:hypothetical protein [Anaerolineae bacterium]